MSFCLMRHDKVPKGYLENEHGNLSFIYVVCERIRKAKGKRIE